MFSLFKHKKVETNDLYDDILDASRNLKLYTDYDVPDNPQGRFQMIALHATPYLLAFSRDEKPLESQSLFDNIFNEIELSFREIGVGDLAVPKKMKRYMQDFNGIIQAHAISNADHADITRRNVFGDDGVIKDNFIAYINELFRN